MKIIIVKENAKAGERFYAYYSGLLSFLGIYCGLNRMIWWGCSTKENCIKAAKEKLVPDPKPDKKVICKIEI